MSLSKFKALQNASQEVIWFGRSETKAGEKTRIAEKLERFCKTKQNKNHQTNPFSDIDSVAPKTQLVNVSIYNF